MPFLRRYGVSDTIQFPMIKRGVVDFASGSADWVPATGDTLISIDLASRSYAANLPVANGAAWALTLTAGELTGKQIRVAIVDSATKAVEDQMILIETYGNVAAQQPWDFNASTVTLSEPARIDLTNQIWATGSRSLTTFGTLQGDVVHAVWATPSRTLSATGNTDAATAVWATVGAIGKTYGLMVSELNALQVLRVAQCVSATAATVTLDAGASSSDQYYNRALITIATGTGAGQTRMINSYDGGTQTATLNRAWLTTPSAGDYFGILAMGSTRNASDVSLGTVQGATASTVDLESTEPAVDDYYTRMFVLIESGTGEGQARLISGYASTSRRCTLARDWVTTPATDSRYTILPFGSVQVTAMGTDAVTADSVSAAAGAKLADITLRRSYASAQVSADGDALAFRSLLGAEAKLVNKVQVNGTNLEIMHADDTSVFGTQAITTDSAAAPITVLDTT